MREMNTDRPDKTESPFTVDTGHFQIEADILSYGYDRYNPAHTDTRVETVAIAPVNLKLGVRNDLICSSSWKPTLRSEHTTFPPHGRKEPGFR